MTVPPAVAVKRLMARNSLREEAALARLRSQTSNRARAAHAHVLLANDQDFAATRPQLRLAAEVRTRKLGCRQRERTCRRIV